MIKLLMLFFMFQINIKNNSEVFVFNPVRYDLQLEIKCNWNGKKFSHRRFYNLNGKSKVKILIPDGSKCQIWPSLR